MNFIDRKGKEINKRRLHIIDNKNSYMDVRIEPLDEGVTVEGTPINAAMFMSWEARMNAMEQKLLAATKLVEALQSEPDVSEANCTGIPSVTLANGRLKFSHLKGESGSNYSITDIGDKYVFYISDDGYLCVDYLESEEPPFVIENGNLVIKF